MSSRPVLPRAVIALGITSLLADIASEMIVPILPLFVTSMIGAHALQLGVIEGVGNTTASLLKLVSGSWSDRLARRRPLVFGGYALTALTRPLLALASSWSWVLGCRFLDRCGKGLRGAPRDAMIAELTDPRLHGRAYGLHRAMDHCGALLGPLLAALCLALALDPRSIILWAFVPGAIAALVVLFGVDEPTRRLSSSRPTSIRLARFDSKFESALLLAALGLRAIGSPAELLLLLRLIEGALSPIEVALVYAGFNGVKSVVTYVAGRTSDRFAPRIVVLFGWVVEAGALWMLSVVTHSQSWVIALLIYAVASGWSEPGEKSFVASLAPAEERGRCFGWYHLTLGLGALPGGLLMGSVWDRFGAELAFGLASLAMGLAAAIAFLATRRGAPLLER